MDIDKINDIDLLKDLLKKNMVRLKKTIETPTHIYKKDEYYFLIQDDYGVFIYLDTPTVGLSLSYDEAFEIFA
jgi:hypothetical protein